ncbi:MAG: OsmC family protein [Actinomycetota bacterium]
MAVVSVSNGTFRVEATTGRHRLTVDEGERLGGTDSGPDPFELIAASLGACTAIVVVDAARERDLRVDRVEVRVTLKFNKLCNRPGDPQLQLVELRRLIDIRADLGPDDLEWLCARGSDCPVSRAIADGVVITTKIAYRPGTGKSVSL